MKQRHKPHDPDNPPRAAGGDRSALRRGALHFNLIFSFCKELQP